MTRRGVSAFLFILLGVVLLGYGAFEAHKLLAGPGIAVAYPADGSATSSPLVAVGGEARSIAFLTINDAPAYVDESGRFSQLLSPAPGVTVITVAAVDRFGRKAAQTVTVTVLAYCPV